MSLAKNVTGYLPDERPTFWKLLIYALQQVVVMFPATVAVALITGFQVSTTLFASGIATLCFIFITGRKIPLYYGSSFSYLTAVISLMTSKAITEKLSGESLTQLQSWLNHTTSVMPAEAISYAQFGIIMSGFVSIAAGLLVRFSGRGAVEKILPPSITGSIAMIIGLTLAANAIGDAAPALVTETSKGIGTTSWVWVVSLVTLLSTIFFSRYLRGFLGQLPLLLGAAAGCATAAILYAIGGADMNLFRSIPKEAIASSLWSIGPFAVPAFTLPKYSLEALIAIMPIAIATIPESTAHIYQLDIYVNNLAQKKQSPKKYNLVQYLDRNLIGDGICDMISGFVGGPAGTNYGENISTMAITKVFSTAVLIVAAIIAMVISFFTPLIQGIYAIPLPVIGGLEVYLFGAIAAQGIAIMIDKKVDMFDSKNIAVISTIMIIGVGGRFAFGGNIPFFGLQIPCIAGAAIFGIVLNLLLSIGKKPETPVEAIAE